MRHRVARAAMLLALLAAGLVLPGPWTLEAQGVPVATTQAELIGIPSRVRLSGSVVSPRSARVSTELGGMVQEMKVDIGHRVERGDPLVQLDAILERLELQRAQAATREAQEALVDAQREVNVGRRLIQNRNMPQNELDARVARARIASAAVARLQAEEARWAERVRRHTIPAPFTGVVAERVAHEGEWVAPGAAVVELVETERLFVDVPVPQHYFPELVDAPGVSLHFHAFPGREFPARVEARVPVSDPTARTFTLRLRPETGDVQLTPGMSARVTLELSSGERGVVVPRDAVIRYPDSRTTVWVVETEGDVSKVSEHQVELGEAFDGQVHILSGVAAGSQIVVRGNEALREGQRVRLSDGKS